MEKKLLSIKVDKQSELLSFLIEKLPGYKRKKIKSMLLYKKISVNGVMTTKHNFILKPGMLVSIDSNSSNKNIPLYGVKIIFEDSSIIIIDKPEGLLSVQAFKENKQLTAFGIVRNYLQNKNPNSKLFIVHRLDKETSGLMMFARSNLIQRKLRDNWQTLVYDRRYIAVVEGSVEKNTGVIISNLKEDDEHVMHSCNNGEEGKKAETHYKLINKNNKFSMLDIKLKTGRKNQIRVHMKEIGHPIVGDIKYNAKENPVNRLCLHAKSLVFFHPVTGKKLNFVSEAPDSFEKLIN